MSDKRYTLEELRDYDRCDTDAMLDWCAEEIERLRTLHADSPTRHYGGGDANALWERIESFRQNPDATLSADDVRELAEWWREIHDRLGDMDEELCEARDENERIRELHAEEGAKWEGRINELQAIVDTLTAGAEWCGLVVEPAIGVNVCLWTLPNCDGREGRTLLEAAEAARKEQA